MGRLEKALGRIRVILSGPAPEHVSPGGLRPKPKNLITSESLKRQQKRRSGKPVAFLTEEEESVLKEPIESPRKIDARKSRC